MIGLCATPQVSDYNEERLGGAIAISGQQVPALRCIGIQFPTILLGWLNEAFIRGIIRIILD